MRGVGDAGEKESQSFLFLLLFGSCFCLFACFVLFSFVGMNCRDEERMGGGWEVSGILCKVETHWSPVLVTGRAPDQTETMLKKPERVGTEEDQLQLSCGLHRHKHIHVPAHTEKMKKKWQVLNNPWKQDQSTRQVHSPTLFNLFAELA